jgi:serine acetyltransferase
MREDIRGMVVYRRGGRFSRAATVLLKLLLYPRIQAVLLFRVAHWLHQKRLTRHLHITCNLSSCGTPAQRFTRRLRLDRASV